MPVPLGRVPLGRVPLGRVPLGRCLSRTMAVLSSCAVVLGPVVLCQQRHNRLFELVDTAELAIEQSRYHPAFDDLHRRFSLGLVLGIARPCRQNRGVLVAIGVEHRVVAARLVAVGVQDSEPSDCRIRCAGVRRRSSSVHAPVKSNLSAMVSRGAGAGIVRAVHGGDENLRAAAIGQAVGEASVIDEQLFAGAAYLAHRAPDLPGEAPVVFAELGPPT